MGMWVPELLIKREEEEEIKEIIIIIIFGVGDRACVLFYKTLCLGICNCYQILDHTPSC